MGALIVVVLGVLRDLIRIGFRTRTEIIAENLFLRRQLALYQERKIRRRRPTPPAKLALVVLSRFFPSAPALAIVQSSTFVRRHRAGFGLFWRWKSRPVGRPPLPKNLQTLILTMADENPTWGEGRIADELSLKLGCSWMRRPLANSSSKRADRVYHAISDGLPLSRIRRLKLSPATFLPQ